jgi:hypothetical protein
MILSRVATGDVDDIEVANRESVVPGHPKWGRTDPSPSSDLPAQAGIAREVGLGWLETPAPVSAQSSGPVEERHGGWTHAASRVTNVTTNLRGDQTWR